MHRHSATLFALLILCPALPAQEAVPVILRSLDRSAGRLEVESRTSKQRRTVALARGQDVEITLDGEPASLDRLTPFMEAELTIVGRAYNLPIVSAIHARSWKVQTEDTEEDKAREARRQQARDADRLRNQFLRGDWVERETGDFPPHSEARTVGSTVNLFRFVVFQVVDEETMLVRAEGRPSVGGKLQGEARELYYFEGFPTRGLTDGKVLDLKGRFRIASTTRYKTALGGSRTVWLVRPHDSED